MTMSDIIVPFEQEGTKAIVRSWLKKLGDRVELNDPLVELETDKVTQEVSATASGILAEILLDTDAEAVPGGVLVLRLCKHPSTIVHTKQPPPGFPPPSDGGYRCTGLVPG
jgi:2-oxoglutarate dehydrogenase E2 component (dihydrolipoamide succinyltransferase)